MRIYGAKGGGGSSHTPIEAPETGRSKQIVNIVELLCEGEIEGFKIIKAIPIPPMLI
ncbi:hypothetical protein P2I59_11980 [Mannheimia haemolytica]|nr:hypothetical protein [Mannheimia haemolytica]